MADNLNCSLLTSVVSKETETKDELGEKEEQKGTSSCWKIIIYTYISLRQRKICNIAFFPLQNPDDNFPTPEPMLGEEFIEPRCSFSNNRLWKIP